MSFLSEQEKDLLDRIWPEAPVDHLRVLDNRFVRILVVDMASMNTHVVVNIFKRVECQSLGPEIIGVFLGIDTGVVEITEEAFVLEVSLRHDIWFSRTWVLEIFIVHPLALSAS